MSSNKKSISIVVPVYNEVHAVKDLIMRLEKALQPLKRQYEVIFIDDHSSDGTFDAVKNHKSARIKIFSKEGSKGKSFSLKEGFDRASGSILIMIDGDLQYPPEAIPEMISILDSKKADIVVANRKKYKAPFIRKVLSTAFRTIFGKMIFNLPFDIQSGLKAFTSEVYKSVDIKPTSGWTFDLEFLYRASHAGFRIKSKNITFENRTKDKTKIGILNTSWEIGLNAFRVKLLQLLPSLSIPRKNTAINAGIRYKGKQYITHTSLPVSDSAIITATRMQKSFVFILFVLLIVGSIINPLLTLQIGIGALSFIYFIDVLFNAFLIRRSLVSEQEITITDKQLSRLDDDQLPIYTILCPLYKEYEVIDDFIDAIWKMDWPNDKLDVLLLLEEDDTQTIQAVQSMELPSFVRILVVPDSLPKTKPKACNFGLLHAKGDFVVIYDAEDQPDPQQLKKAYIAFNRVPKDVVCLQAKLNYYNPNQNIITRLFTAEYSLWFDLTLTGLQSFNTVIPLGGTSNHFRKKDLLALKGWDAFNVTEDADLGIRLFKKGYKTAIINSTTHEEANSRILNWIRQRSRWIKGYMQTFLVHNRHPLEFAKLSKLDYLLFNLTIGGKIAFILINPILWIMTFIYFAARTTVGPVIEMLYPAPVFYMALISLVAGNFMFMYFYMIGCAKRGQWHLVKYTFLIPFYWVILSIAGAMAAYQLVFKPHYWEKTVHGFYRPKPSVPFSPKPTAVMSGTFALSSDTDIEKNQLVQDTTGNDESVFSIGENSRQIHWKEIYQKHPYAINGFLFVFLAIILNITNAFVLGVPYKAEGFVNFGALSIGMIVLYFLLAPVQISSESFSNKRRFIHFLSISAFLLSTIHSVINIQSGSISASQFAVFSGIQLMSLGVLGMYFYNSRTHIGSLPVSVMSGKKYGTKDDRLKILVFNWRDTKHAWAGGAEKYIQEISQRWVNYGHKVTLFCSNDRHNKNREIVNGVEVIRKGGTYTIYPIALLYYIFKFRGKYDLIIDCENGIPFFTPLFVRKPIFLVIYHIHQDVFRQHLIKPAAVIARFLEAKVMPFLYRNIPIITISKSSKKDISKLGFTNNPINIVYSGVDEILHPGLKTEYPSFTYLGRLKAYKQIDIAIKAFAQVIKKVPEARLTIAGDGELDIRLRSLVKKLHLENTVIFTGKISEKEKLNLLSSSWACVQPSKFEGWGLTVIESNACGTPVIASKVNGLKDSVVHNSTGVLVKPNDITGFSNAMIRLAQDEEFRSFISEQSFHWSQNFNWDKSSEYFLKILENELYSRRDTHVYQPEVAGT